MRRSVCGKRAALQQALVNAGVFGIALVFGAELVVLAVQLFDLVMNRVERADVGGHFFLRDFAEFLLLEQPLQLFLEGDELRVLLVEVVGQRFTGLAQGVFELVGQYQLFFPDLGEHEQHVFQRDIEQVAGVGG